MRILKLEILNLASLDNKDGEVIDFETGALKNSSLFSIVGPTGSGKSTILDAICLALYNRAPRYPRVKRERKQFIEIYGERDDDEKKRIAPTDCRNILSHGKKNGYSKLTFVANNGNVYRAEWSVRFRQKVYGDAVTSLVRLENEGGKVNEVVCEWNDIPAIIGLEYEQFLRTVLIAQGSFANFLTANEDERYKLLEKLIGCEEVYKTIAAAIKEEKDSAEEVFKTIDAQCSVYGESIIPSEQLEQIQKRIEELKAEEEETREELKQITEALQWYKAETEHSQRVELAKNNVEEAKRLLEDVAEEKETLAMHDVTIKPVSILGDAKKTKAKIVKYEADIIAWEKNKESMAARIDEGGKNLDILKKEIAKAEADYDDQKPHINAARTIKVELENAVSSQKEKTEARTDAQNALNSAAKTLDDNVRQIAEAEQKLQSAVSESNVLKTKTDEKRQQLAAKANSDSDSFDAENNKLQAIDAQVLQNAKSIAEQVSNDLSNAIRIEQQRAAKRQNIQENIQLLERVVSRNKIIESELGGLNIVALESELETLRKTQTLMTSENWAMHRNELKEGDKCPLCGSTVHPFCGNDEFDHIVSDLGDIVDEKQKAVNETRARIAELTKEQGSNNGTIRAVNQTNARLQDELNQLNSEWDKLKHTYMELPESVEELTAMKEKSIADVENATSNLNAYNALAKMVAALRVAMDASAKALKEFQEKAADAIHNAETKVNQANTKFTTEKGRTEDLRSQLEEKQQALQIAKLALGNAEALVADKRKALFDEIGNNDPDVMDKRLADALKAAQKKEADARDALSKLRESMMTLEGQISNAKTSRDEEKAALEKAKEEFDAWIADYNSKNERQLTAQTIADLYADNRDWEALRKQINDLQTNLTAKSSALVVETSTYNKHLENRPELTQEELEERQAELSARDNEELTAIKARKKAHDDADAALGGLLIEREAAQALVNEWTEIYKAIGANEGETLRKIAQCYTLRFLVEHANAEIRKFNSRYELVQVKNSLGLRVIDHNRADVVRDTTSLSGGETFIVSLGLALGLSSLSSRNVRFENLFIDEGFGTLDPETLTTVIESLRMLQSSQGKKVCIISHTEKMRENIPTQIEIIKNGNSGSSYIKIHP